MKNNEIKIKTKIKINKKINQKEKSQLTTFNQIHRVSARGFEAKLSDIPTFEMMLHQVSI